MYRKTLYGVCIAAFISTFVSSSRSNAADNETKELAKARVEVATKGFESAMTLHDMWVWSGRLLNAELALCDSRDSRIAVLENQLRRMEKLENLVVEGSKTGLYSSSELMEAKYYRIDNMLRLAEEKDKKSEESK